MADALATATRLLGALEQLASEEDACLLSGEEMELAEVLARADPMVQRLATLARSPGLDSLLPQLTKWLQLRQERWLFLEASKRDLREGLLHFGEVQSRLVKIAPAYGRLAKHTTGPRFHAEA